MPAVRGIARKALTVLLVVVLMAALGIVGRMDYEDRCRALSPASIEETR